MDERLHKLLAQRGLGSRRDIEQWIRAGRVLVNGQPALIGQRVGPRDRIVVDGKDVTRRAAAMPQLRVIGYHKPGGELLRGRHGDERAPIDLRLPSPRAGRWLPINTLGFADDGLLILSNDGGLASAAARLGRNLEVEYRVRVLRPRDASEWPTLPRDVDVDGQRVEFSEIQRVEGSGSNVWFRIVGPRALPRGAIRALFDAAGLKLGRTILIRWGAIALPRDLPRGRWRDLPDEDVKFLMNLAGRDAGRGRAFAKRSVGPRRTAPRGLKRRAGPRTGAR